MTNVILQVDVFTFIYRIDGAAETLTAGKPHQIRLSLDIEKLTPCNVHCPTQGGGTVMAALPLLRPEDYAPDFVLSNLCQEALSVTLPYTAGGVINGSSLRQMGPHTPFRG